MNIRKTAYETLLSIIENGAYSNLALKEASKNLTAENKAFLYALVYTSLEHKEYIEYILSHFCKRQKKAVRTVLLLSSSELLYLHTPVHAVINEAVSLTRSLGKSPSCGLVNAVLRRLDREKGNLPPLPADPVKRLSILYGCPEFILQEWIDSFGLNGTEAILAKKPSKIQIRAQFPFTVYELQKELPCSFSVGKLDPNCLYLDKAPSLENWPLYQDGKVTVQNEGSMMICRSLGDLKNASVLDACAAPGGKSAYLASLNENHISLTCWEVHPHRKELLDSAFSRLHVAAHTECRDAAAVHKEYFDRFDAVLLDVPCSGFGLFADKPDLRYRKTQADIDALCKIQSEILSACSSYVKQGGKLVYSTCTISKRENEQQVLSFLNSRTDYEMMEQRQFLPHTDGIDGFFYAVMKRR